MNPSRARFPLLLLAMLALLAAIWSGLLRIGWRWPALQPMLPAAHGPLMVSGFLGTLISLERAVAVAGRTAGLARNWPFLAPLLCGIGSLFFIFGFPATPGILLMAFGSLVLVAIFVLIVRQQPALFTGVMALGAVVWALGNLLWLTGRSVPAVVPWWVGFLVLTIAGERLELSRLARVSGEGRLLFVVVVGALLGGVVISQIAFDVGMRVLGLGLAGLALWLARYDLARRTVRQLGLTRFIAVCMLSGYVWLGIGGLLALIFGGRVAGPEYDALLHAIFLGFVFSMIFGHAPIIFPAVFGLAIPYRPAFYAHLVLLHASLVLRVVGDLAGWFPGRQWGGLINGVALLLFLANTIYAARQSRRPAVAIS